MRRREETLQLPKMYEEVKGGPERAVRRGGEQECVNRGGALPVEGGGRAKACDMAILFSGHYRLHLM